MKKPIKLILVLLLLNQLLFAGKQENYLWPIKGEKAGTNIIYKPQDLIKGELNNDNLFIGGKEGDIVVAPCDGEISYVTYIYKRSLKSGKSSRWTDEGSDIQKQHESCIVNLAKRFNKKSGIVVLAKNINYSISLRCGEGTKVHIGGLIPIKYFKTGTKIKRGDIIGKISFSYHNIEKPSINFSISKYGKSIDPMGVFGLKTSFVTSNKKSKIDYVTHKFSANELQEDFKVFKDALEEGHPGLYDYCTKEELDKTFDEIKERISEPMTSNKFLKLLSKIGILIKDSHLTTRSIEVNYTTDFPRLSLSYGVENGKMKIFLVPESDKELLGKIITKIDGIDVDEIIKYIEARMRDEGTSRTSKSTLYFLCLSFFIVAFMRKKLEIK